MKNYPEYLKLHIEEQPPADAPEASQRHESRGLESLETALQSIGWKLACCDLDVPLDRHDWSMTLREGTDHAKRLVLSPSVAADVVPLERVQPVAQAIGTLVDELLETHGRHLATGGGTGGGHSCHTTRRRPACTCAASGVGARGGAEAIGCQAAALYLLDDATSYLKMRRGLAVAQEPIVGRTSPVTGKCGRPGSLGGTRGGVRGHVSAAALESAGRFSFGIVCARGHQLHAARYLVALRHACASSRPSRFTWWKLSLAASLRIWNERCCDVKASSLRSTDQALEALVNCQDELRPQMPPLVDGWQVAASNNHQQSVSKQFYDWFIVPDGRIAVAVGHAEGPTVEAGLTCTMLQIALRSHAAHSHEPRQMLDLLSEDLWTQSTGNRFASLSYALIDPDSGQFIYASAGENHGLVHSNDSPLTLTDGNPALGYDPDHRYRQSTHVLELGQSLVFFTRDDISPCEEEFRDPDECQVAELLQELVGSTAEAEVQAIIGRLQDNGRIAIARSLSCGDFLA